MTSPTTHRLKHSASGIRLSERNSLLLRVTVPFHTFVESRCFFVFTHTQLETSHSENDKLKEDEFRCWCFLSSALTQIVTSNGETPFCPGTTSVVLSHTAVRSDTWRRSFWPSSKTSPWSTSRISSMAITAFFSTAHSWGRESFWPGSTTTRLSRTRSSLMTDGGPMPDASMEVGDMCNKWGVRMRKGVLALQLCFEIHTIRDWNQIENGNSQARKNSHNSAIK